MPNKRLSHARRFVPSCDQADVDRLASELDSRSKEMTPKELADFDKQIDTSYPGGFTARDEANALIAMTVRNGPLEELHAGRHSDLLNDDTLSRISDEEMKVLMIHATRMLARLLRLRESHPEVYQRCIRGYGRMYCRSWERDA
jgi:hypothetical protein